MNVDIPIYEAKSITHYYGDKPVLDIPQLKIEESSIVGLVGPNGSGKSTLLRLLGLIERPTRGEIRFDGHLSEPFSDDARFQITMLPQESLLMKRSVFRNVAYGLKLRGPRGNLRDRVGGALSLVGLASEDFSRRPWYALSGGEIQRVALAARLALKPRVLLLDEPTASVDAASAQMIKEAALRARQEWGTTLVVASHDRQWLNEVCDSILHVFQGKIFGSGRETAVFGPWHELDRGWGKTLSDNQEIRVSEPPDKDAVAIIDFSINDDDSKKDPDVVRLNGTVSMLSLDKNTGRVYVSIIAGSQPVTVGLKYEEIQLQGIFPGKTVSINYDFRKIKWV
jgi:tungstate transport system ATP-binding protein